MPIHTPDTSRPPSPHPCILLLFPAFSRIYYLLTLAIFHDAVSPLPSYPHPSPLPRHNNTPPRTHPCANTPANPSHIRLSYPCKKCKKKMFFLRHPGREREGGVLRFFGGSYSLVRTLFSKALSAAASVREASIAALMKHLDMTRAQAEKTLDS